MATWTEADITTLKSAIASGVLTVTFDGPPRRSVTYQDLRSMRELLAAMQADVTASSGGRPPATLISSSKGL